MHQLLSEEELNELVGAALALPFRAAGALIRGAGNKITPGLTKQALPSIASRASAQRMANQQFAQTVSARMGISPNSWLGKKQRASIAAKIRKDGRKAYEAAVYHNMQVVTQAQQRLSNIGLSIFNTAFFAYALNDYLKARWALDPNDKDYEQKLNQLNGEFIMGFVGGKIVGVLGKLTANTVGKLIKLSGLPKAGEYTKRWLSHVAKVGEAAAMVYFQTKDGKALITNLIGHDIMQAIGAGVEWTKGVVEQTISFLKDVWDEGLDAAVQKHLGVNMTIPKFGDAYKDTKFAGTVTKTFEPSK